ncbi:hypothetical protein VOLCADRAFT_66969 [Volvox carteri f. nagariensis]|uniref:O-phosphoseryl-tRNA(Sec) selenium transferase n=1 Tax=Volvox carteri f. nagariensis TaxID=3068 RepID=D8UCG3_VOLCA|nr:uncharacterized protein VOLCADRAFT_66969 [Volvox carteri f. nagariensis]EFJ42488.1 hypothetical protein VOLCADRAFT_66969 [Volvox carteri f. nagariensis]|eukprot:XP_002956344.1 hypothetical protein VOLCADRAFT_66969 [Volvox carteri f. nagariensis]
MNPDNCALASGLISLSYIRQGEQALARRQRLVKSLLSSRRLPERGWDEATIEMLIRDCSAMDSNNFLDNVGLGEREGRVVCPLVARRHFGLAHGIGRSGDVAAEQPKAAGSSLLAALTNHLAADALGIAGLTGIGPVTTLPLATGMALTLVLLALRSTRPPGADLVVWSRVDQKTCLKAITAAGLRPHAVQLRRRGDELVTDVQAISQAVDSLGPDRIVAVITTTSCFAPRAPDDVTAVARLCDTAAVPHVINNAYGVQSRQTCRAVAAAWSRGRVDAVVQSTDKNFMVPVGGALVAAPAARPGLVAAVNGTYPGRASVAAHLDLLMTLLHWGAAGWRKVLLEREELVPYLRDRLRQVAARQGERLLDTPNNPISMALTLDTLAVVAVAATAPRRPPDVTFFGAMLWSRCVSGTRVVAPGKTQSVGGVAFRNYGSHTEVPYPSTYMTAAAALGTTRADVDELVVRLNRCFTEFRKKCHTAAAAAAFTADAADEAGGVAEGAAVVGTTGGVRTRRVEQEDANGDAAGVVGGSMGGDCPTDGQEGQVAEDKVAASATSQ